MFVSQSTGWFALLWVSVQVNNGISAISCVRSAQLFRKARPRSPSPAFSLEPLLTCGARLQDSPALQETWLLLELCDKGSLQDAMDRGAFRSVRIGYEGSVVGS